MNAVTVIEAASVSATAFDAWLNRLRELFDQRRAVHWKIADCLHEGKEAGHLTQGGLDLLSEELGVAPKPLKDAIKAAAAFPPSIRDSTLSIEHHAAAADLPDAQTKMEFLTRAKREHWSPEQVRHEVMNAKPRDGRQVEESPLESFLRHWNRLPRTVRFEAAEMIAASHGEEIEP